MSDPLSNLRAGDAAAFDHYYDLHRRELFSFLARLTGRRAVAEELLQETFLRLVRHRGSLRGDTNVRAWLYTVAGNLARDDARRRSRRYAFESPLPPRTPLACSEARAETSHLERALQRLSANDRHLLLLLGQGFTPTELAQMWGIAPTAVRKRLSRARTRLRTQLSDTKHVQDTAWKTTTPSSNS